MPRKEEEGKTGLGEAPRNMSDFQLKLANDRSFYSRSPVARFTKENGDLSPDRYPSKHINRRLKMQDSFTRVLPAYAHAPVSCYTGSASHKLHPIYRQSVDRKPAADIDRRYTHKFDPFKEYTEEVLKMGTFGVSEKANFKPRLEEL